VTDHLTGLQWEKNTNADNTANPADPHDADNSYTWSATGAAGNGTIYTSFLAKLNDNVGGCFAGQCDWRLPTVLELQTILAQPYPCATGPCIDTGFFGPTSQFSAPWTSMPSVDAASAWVVVFTDGAVDQATTTANLLAGARAVRGGL